MDAAINLNALILLVDIIDSGSLKSAAARNQISTSAISHSLKKLETSLGTQLLRRTTRRIEPTEMGRRLYERGRVIAGELAQVRSEVSFAGQVPHGPVRLSIPAGLGTALISPLLIEFKQLYPLVELEVLFENRIFNLLSDKVDVALRIISSPPEFLHAMDLGEVNWVLCASPSYWENNDIPIQPADLSRLDIVCAAPVGAKLNISIRADNGEKTTLAVKPSLRSDNFLFLKQAVLAGLGVGILPFYQVEADLASGRLIGAMLDFRFSVFGRKVILLTVPDRFRTAASSALIGYLRQRVSVELAAQADRFARVRLAVPVAQEQSNRATPR
ncbi:LysR family transcriptional regulator [Acinetobacter gerneri]|uniref:LysR family transcriptional regulator n=1 Tax=Acinetobacter gerneri TaxID=202952 RepID=UPI003AF9B0A0